MSREKPHITRDKWEALIDQQFHINPYEEADKLMIYEYLLNSGYQDSADFFFEEAQLDKVKQ